jgi:alpha-methylacyl-CoA racemase
MLADLGAAVVKVEPLSGDPMRGIAWYELLNAGKRVVRLDLRDAEGRAELDAMLASARVCVEGFRPATARALGVDAASLRARHSRLVHCSISGYGQSGPDAERAGHDLNYQAEAGLLAGSTSTPPLLIADITGALHATIRILAALAGSGGGASLDVSLAAAARAWTPFLPPPTLRGDYACYNVYQTGDGHAVALGALEAKFWIRFCRAAGRDAWIPLQFAADPQRSELLRETAGLFRARTLVECIDQFAPVDCCFSAIARP